MTLTHYLTSVNTPERLALLLEALETVGAYNLTDIISEIEGLFNTELVDEPALMRNAVNNIIIEYLCFIIRDHEIALSSNPSNLRTLMEIAKTLYRATEEFDPEYILERVNCVPTLQCDAKAQLGDLVKLIEGTSLEDYNESVLTVSDNLIKILKDNLEARISTPPVSSDPSVLLRYKSFLEGRQHGVVFEVVNQTQIVGDKAPQVLMALVHDMLMDLSPEEKAFELTSLALISKTDDINATITKFIYQLSTDDLSEDVIGDAVKLGYPSWTK